MGGTSRKIGTNTRPVRRNPDPTRTVGDNDQVRDTSSNDSGFGLGSFLLGAAIFSGNPDDN